MGCQTGFYLLVRDADNSEVLAVLKKALADTIASPEMFGQSRIECGNYQNLSLEAAKVECERYLRILESRVNDFEYK
jgi:S-ribosylhomocysteine lyase